MDWNKLKAEYIAGGTSYRKLAEKYGIDRNAVQKIGTKEKWAELKSRAKAKAESKMVNSISSDIARSSVKLNDVCDKVLDKIADILSTYDELDTQAIKHITSSLKDIKDIKGVKSEIDLKEQNARIDKLRKDIEADKVDDDKPCGVVLMPTIMPDLVPPSEEDDDG